jgi:pilus assembly protein CpaE
VHPFDEAQLNACLGAWAGMREADMTRGGLVCFLPARPGDGASTVALHAALAAARQRRRNGVQRKVLLVDFDFQTGSIAFRLRLEPPATLADALSLASAAGPPWPRLVCPWSDLDVLASPAALAIPGQLSRVETVFATARQAYSLVVVDMPAALHSSSHAVLKAADEVHLLCTPDAASVHLARRRISELRDIGVAPPRLRLVLNRNGSHSWIGAEELRLATGLPVSSVLDNDYARLHAAVVRGEIISPRSRLGRQMAALGCRLGVLGKRLLAA